MRAAANTQHTARTAAVTVTVTYLVASLVVLLLIVTLVTGCSVAAGNEPGAAGPSRSTDAGASEGGARASDVSAPGRAAVRLARRGGDLDAVGLRRLDGILAENLEVRGFPAEFATSLGARGTLRFWAAVRSADAGPRDARDRRDRRGSRDARDPRDSRDPRRKTVQRLRVDLGHTLAAASRTDSPAVDGWLRGLIAAGDRRLGDGPGAAPHGFQIVSDLMGDGEWDARFLDDYGRRLLAFEREAVGRGTSPESLWAGGQAPVDPLAGLLRAVSHSPDAATRLVNDRSLFTRGRTKGRSTAEYLLRHRDYFDAGDGTGVVTASPGAVAGGAASPDGPGPTVGPGTPEGPGSPAPAPAEHPDAVRRPDAVRQRPTLDALGAALFAAGSGRTPEDRTSEYAEPTRAQLAATRTGLRLLTADGAFPPELRAGVGRLLAHHGRLTYETATEPSPARVPFDRAVVAKAITEVARDGATLGVLDRTLNEVAVHDFRVERRKRQKGGGSAFRAGRVNGFLRFAAGAAFPDEEEPRVVRGPWSTSAAAAVAGGGLGYVPVTGEPAHPGAPVDELVRAIAEGYLRGDADGAFSARRMPKQALTDSWLATNRDRLPEYQGEGIPEFDGYSLTQWFQVGFEDGEEAARQAGAVETVRGKEQRR